MTPESAIANPAGITAGTPPPAAGTALGAGPVAALAVAIQTLPMRSEAPPVKTEAVPMKAEALPTKAEALPTKTEARPMKTEARPMKTEALPMKAKTRPMEAGTVYLGPKAASVRLKGLLKRLFQHPVAAEVTRLKLQRFQSLLTSAATVLNEALKSVFAYPKTWNPQPGWLRFGGSAGCQPAGSGGILPPVDHLPAGSNGKKGFPAMPEAGKTGEISLLGAIADRRRSDRCQNRATAAWAFAGFTLVEVLVVVSLLSFIVLALMAVFSSTQRAFRASVTQTDVLGGGRATVDLIASDLRTMTPSDWYSNGVYNAGAFQPQCPVNFSVAANYNNYSPLVQSLPGSAESRTNLLNYFFMLSRENTKWIGIGYVVDNTNSTTLFPLYRYYAETNIQANPYYLLDNFNTAVRYGEWTNMNHVLDGVVNLTVRAYNPNGDWISNTQFPNNTNVQNTVFFVSPPVQYGYGETQLLMLSNAVPATVEIDLGVLEDRPLAHAEALSVPGQAPSQVPALWRYLQGQSGAVHLFRQRVSIPNVDTSAYQ